METIKRNNTLDIARGIAILGMKYGKPVLASNVCSMPEVLADAPIYFSPFYESAIFNVLLKLSDENYTEYTQRSLKRYHEVHEKQENDLKELVKRMLNV